MKCSLFLFILLFSLQTKAITFEDGVFPELVTSTRALAMGNAFVAKVDDASAAFYNPAGLGTIRYPHLHLSNFSFETNKGTIDSISGSGLTDVFSNIPKTMSIDGMRQILVKSPGSIFHSRFQALPNFTSRYFTIGYMLAKRSRGVVNSTTSSTGFEFADRFDHGPYAALNLSLFGGILKFGASGVILYRKEINTSVDPNATAVVSSSSYNTGRSAVVTAGTKITLPFTFLPTFALTIHNATETHFAKTSSGAAPDQIPRTYDAGFSITPQVGTSTRIHLEANFKDMSGRYTDTSVARKMVFGAELDFSRVFFFRVGYGDGFGSGGLGIKSRKLEFDLTTYAVDTTSSSFRGKEDRRFALGISSGF